MNIKGDLCHEHHRESVPRTLQGAYSTNILGNIQQQHNREHLPRSSQGASSTKIIGKSTTRIIWMQLHFYEEKNICQPVVCTHNILAFAVGASQLSQQFKMYPLPALWCISHTSNTSPLLRNHPIRTLNIFSIPISSFACPNEYDLTGGQMSVE